MAPDAALALKRLDAGALENGAWREYRSTSPKRGQADAKLPQHNDIEDITAGVRRTRGTAFCSELWPAELCDIACSSPYAIGGVV